MSFNIKPTTRANKMATIQEVLYENKVWRRKLMLTPQSGAPIHTPLRSRSGVLKTWFRAHACKQMAIFPSCVRNTRLARLPCEPITYCLGMYEYVRSSVLTRRGGDWIASRGAAK